MQISLKNIEKYGFIFHRFNQDLILKNDLSTSIKNLKHYITSLISVEGETLYADIEEFNYQDKISPHYHIIMGSFQAVTWIYDTDDFQGRDFLFGTPNSLNKARPKLGVLCFMKPNDPNYIHGVSQLTSESRIYSLGFSSLTKPFGNENNDIYAKTYQIDSSTTDLLDLV